MQNIVQAVGFIAGTCTTFSFLPQVIKVWKTRSAKDISFYMYLLFCIGLALGIVYGYLNHLLPLMLSNGVTLVLAFSILWMKMKCRS